MDKCITHKKPLTAVSAISTTSHNHHRQAGLWVLLAIYPYSAMRGKVRNAKSGPQMRPFFHWSKTNMQKIAVFALSTDKPLWASVLFSGGTLTINEVKSLSGKLSHQVEKVRPAIGKLVESGFNVLVDEISPIASQGTGAKVIRLANKHSDDRPVLVVGMERYKELSRQGALVMPPRSGSRYTIPDDIVESEFNSAGDEVYRVNWQSLTAEHMIVILACYASLYHNVASANYIKGMNETTVEEKRKMPALFSRLLASYEAEKAEGSTESYSGTVEKDGSVIL